ncbi:MAG: alpha-galactosidase [Christensenellaceae bacterium]
MFTTCRAAYIRFPNVFFEGCASGGGSSTRCSIIPRVWTSDDTDGYRRAKIQWGARRLLSALGYEVAMYLLAQITKQDG